MATNLEHYKEEITKKAKDNDICSFVIDHILENH